MTNETKPEVTVTDTLIATGYLDENGKFVPAEKEPVTALESVTYVQDEETPQ